MKKAILFALSTVAVAPAFASVCGENMACHISTGPTLLTIAPFVGTSQTFGYSEMVPKVVLAAREDAAYFVSSNGEVRTAQFEEALQAVRIMNPEAAASDMDIAQAILAL